MLTQPQVPSTIDALARCRQTVLTRANELIGEGNPVPLPERADVLSPVVGLLMTSLEELKVAEEELREQNVRLAESRSAEDALLAHYRALFTHVPMPALVTDLYATIAEANAAAVEMFGREARYLERKPLTALVDPRQRDAFRKQLARIALVEEPTRWSLTLTRQGDVPIDVQATVKVVPSLGPTRSGVLFWLLQPRVVDN